METKRCPYCGEEILAVAKKCKFCGEWLNETSVPEQIDCPICAERIDANATVCPFCHEPVNPSSNTAEHTKTSSQHPINDSTCMAPTKNTVSMSPRTYVVETDEGDAVSQGLFKTYLWNVITQHYADFKGSMGRKAYWMYILLYGMFSYLVSIGLMLCNPTLGWVVYAILCLGFLAPTLSAAIRRLHDIRKNGWMILVGLIPLIGPIWLLILLCKKGESESPRAKWQLSDTIHASIMTIILVLGIIISTVGGEKYYVYEDSDWTPDCDFSWFYAVASDNKKDTEPSDYIDRHGAQLIVAAEEPFGEVRKIISSEDIAAKNPNVGKDLRYEIFPSSIDPDLIYFNYWMNGMECPLYGKVDSKTGEFNLFNGAIVGIISYGEFEDCFMKVELGVTNGVKIYKQSAVGENSPEMVAFDINEFWPRRSNEDLIFNKKFAAKVIESFSEN